MSMTPENAAQFVGGGDRDYAEGEAKRVAEQIATASNDYARYAETRGLDERFATVPATVRAEDGTTETTNVPRLPQDATSVPEGFGGSTDDDDDNTDPEDDEGFGGTDPDNDE